MMHLRLAVLATPLLFLPAAVAAPDEPISADPPLQWYMGNLHTHSFWSDGNDFPEMIAEWYRDHDYHFLALSDHNTLSQGERWMPLATIKGRGGANVFPDYLARFGEHWVQTREANDAATQVRLKPLGEFRSLFESRGEFIMIQSEEITDSFARLPVHINATNIIEKITPQHGDSVADTIKRNLQAILAQQERTGTPILPHLNHPNFGWGVTAEEMAEVLEEEFFEVHNGHSGTNDLGDDLRAGLDEMWDIINTIRISQMNAPPVFGLATDDSHHHHGRNSVSPPGRGWVMVRARHLTPESLIKAMRAGDFYASSGVTLNDVQFDEATGTLAIKIASSGDATFTTHFIGTREGFNPAHWERVREDGVPIHTTEHYSADVGEVLASETGLNPSYRLTGDELYVRAVVVSSEAADLPSDEHLVKKAWTQPVGWRGRLAEPPEIEVVGD